MSSDRFPDKLCNIKSEFILKKNLLTFVTINQLEKKKTFFRRKTELIFFCFYYIREKMRFYEPMNQEKNLRIIFVGLQIFKSKLRSKNKIINSK